MCGFLAADVNPGPSPDPAPRSSVCVYLSGRPTQLRFQLPWLSTTSLFRRFAASPTSTAESPPSRKKGARLRSRTGDLHVWEEAADRWTWAAYPPRVSKAMRLVCMHLHSETSAQAKEGFGAQGARSVEEAAALCPAKASTPQDQCPSLSLCACLVYSEAPAHSWTVPQPPGPIPWRWQHSSTCARLYTCFTHSCKENDDSCGCTSVSFSPPHQCLPLWSSGTCFDGSIGCQGPSGGCGCV